jgi:Flp pilus assembly protein TadB
LSLKRVNTIKALYSAYRREMKRLIAILLLALAFVGVLNIVELILMYLPWSALLIAPIGIALILRSTLKGWTNDVSNVR